MPTLSASKAKISARGRPGLTSSRTSTIPGRWQTGPAVERAWTFQCLRHSPRRPGAARPIPYPPAPERGRQGRRQRKVHSRAGLLTWLTSKPRLLFLFSPFFFFLL
jgi:hypothetical protein